MAVEFGLLGTVEARVGQRTIDLGPARQRSVLAALLVDANHTVSLEQLADRVWGDDLPYSATATLRSYLSRLRSVLPATDGFGIERRRGGYVLNVSEVAVDLHRFRQLLASARAARDDDAAAALYERALGLWRGGAFAGLDTPWLATTRHELHASHLAARLDYHDVQLRRGRHTWLLAELPGLASAHPLDERLGAQYMLALYRSGRVADALDHYKKMRLRLTEELGIDPSAQLQLLHQQILTADPALSTPTAQPHTEPDTGPTPRQLPPDITGFSGRAEDLAALETILAGHRNDVEAPPLVIAVHGPGGVGKTSLALHWAHRIRSKFPDGQIYLDMRGYGPGAPVDSHSALDVVLRALGVPPARIPAATEERSALLRTWSSGRQLLLLVDNVRDADQVRPLLPGAGGLVLVTSRSDLRGLAIRDGAHRRGLREMSAEESVELVVATIGSDRAEAEPEAVAELVELCGRLPLALVIAAQQAAQYPDAQVSELVAELRAGADRLDILADPDDPSTDPRAVFSWSYEALNTEVARAFRYLGLHPGPEISLPAARALLRVPTGTTRRLLDTLVSVHLLEQDQRGRYRFHDLLRAYAAERVAAQEAPDDRDAAVRRMLDWYLHTLHNARASTFASGWLELIELSDPFVRPQQFADMTDAVAWYESLGSTVVAVIGYAAEHGHDAHGWQLAFLLRRFHQIRRRADDEMRSARLALTCAERLNEDAALIRAYHTMGVAHASAKEFEQAVTWQQRALALSERVGDHAMQVTALTSIGVAHHRTGDQEESARWLRRSVEVARRSGVREEMAHALVNLGATLGADGQLDESLATSHLALEAYTELGIDWYRAFALGNIAEAHMEKAEYAEAVHYADLTLAVLGDIEDRTAAIGALIVKGKALAAHGVPAAAREVWEHALRILLQARDPRADEVRALLTSSA